MSFVESNGTVWVRIAIGMEQENKLIRKIQVIKASRNIEEIKIFNRIKCKEYKNFKLHVYTNYTILFWEVD